MSDEFTGSAKQAVTERAMAFVDALDGGSPREVRRAVAASFSAAAIVAPERPRPGEAVLDGAWALRWARMLGGIRVKAATPFGSRGVRLVAEERHPLASGDAIIYCEVQPEPPYLISMWWHRSLPQRVDRGGTSGEGVGSVESSLDDLSSAGLFSGVVLVQAGEDRVLVGRGAADHTTHTANDPATRFNTASLTKFFTAVAACRLVDGGELDLDGPVNRWLSGRVAYEIGRLTSHQLLLHVAGLPEQVPDIEGSDTITDDWLAALRGVTLDFEPGTAWQYSNVGYALLGAVIERIAGRPYFEAMDDLVFRPAEMSATAFENTSLASPGRALGYRYASDEERLPRLDNLDAGLGRGAPYGYATSTVADIERLLLAVNERRIISDTSASRILDGQLPTGEPGRFAGYGMFVEEHAGRMVITSAGAGPGVSAWLDFVPESGYRAIVLSNSPKPAAHRVGRFLRSRLLDSPT